MHAYFEKYKKSWKPRNSSTTADYLIAGIRIVFAIGYFVAMVLIEIRILPLATHATWNLGYALMVVLLRGVFVTIYFIVDWILFVRTRGS